jgi:cell wall-associated NlpC family hydrolase
MNKFIKYFLFQLLIVLLLSCSSHQETSHKRYIQTSFVNHPQNKSLHQRKIIVQYAIKSLGLPYKWGGESPKTGFDCSGLIVYTHQKADIITPRTAKAQFDYGTVLSKKDLKLGDLIFFTNPKKNIVDHVAIFIGRGKFVHAPGKGRRVSYGYLNNPYFRKRYVGSRSYL